jgi:glycerophosphoryl diester phosphodiesterase
LYRTCSPHVRQIVKARAPYGKEFVSKNLRKYCVVAVLAHRGASAVKPENTVEAFYEARRLGADGVELDVRRSADGALVVHHDATIDGRPIISLCVSELPPEVPLLDAAVAACGDLLVNIELKDLPGEAGYDPGQPLAALVAEFILERDLAGQVLVSSFDLSAVDAILAIEPSIVTGWLTGSGYDQLGALETVVDRGHQALNPHYAGVTPQLVSDAHRFGVAVNTWTVDQPDQIRQLAAAGVDAIITNRPDVARQVLLADLRPVGR